MTYSRTKLKVKSVGAAEAAKLSTPKRNRGLRRSHTHGVRATRLAFRRVEFLARVKHLLNLRLSLRAT